jgi:hypothetical protein
MCGAKDNISMACAAVPNCDLPVSAIHGMMKGILFEDVACATDH